MSENIKEIVPEVGVEHLGRMVLIELICIDEYAARVLFEDVSEKIASKEGFQLRLWGKKVG